MTDGSALWRRLEHGYAALFRFAARGLPWLPCQLGLSALFRGIRDGLSARLDLGTKGCLQIRMFGNQGFKETQGSVVGRIHLSRLDEGIRRLAETSLTL